MALIKCGDCGAEISKKAKVCIKCGAPNKKYIDPKEVFIALITIFVIVFLWNIFSDSSKEVKSSDKTSIDTVVAVKPVCATDDLKCLADDGMFGAAIYCLDDIEKQARYSIKWTNGIIEPVFSRMRWLNKEKGQITYIGDKLQFQNKFGAFENVVYECDLEKDNKTVIATRVRAGRLK